MEVPNDDLPPGQWFTRHDGQRRFVRWCFEPVEESMNPCMFFIFSDGGGHPNKWGGHGHAVVRTDQQIPGYGQMTAGGRNPGSDCVPTVTHAILELFGIDLSVRTLEQWDGTTATGTALYPGLKAGLDSLKAKYGVSYIIEQGTPPPGWIMNPAWAGSIPPSGFGPYGAASQGAYVVFSPPAKPAPAPAPAPAQGEPVWTNRRIALLPNSGDGYELDGWGGLHPIGSMPNATGGTYWKGWNIARDLALNPDGSGGYVMDGWGGLHAFAARGAAPPAVGPPFEVYWPGWDIAGQVIITDWTKQSGYIVDNYGGMHPFRGAPALTGGGYFPPPYDHM